MFSSHFAYVRIKIRCEDFIIILLRIPFCATKTLYLDLMSFLKGVVNYDFVNILLSTGGSLLSLFYALANTLKDEIKPSVKCLEMRLP